MVLSFRVLWILGAWPKHLNWLSLIFLSIGTTHIFKQIYSFCIPSFLVLYQDFQRGQLQCPCPAWKQCRKLNKTMNFGEKNLIYKFHIYYRDLSTGIYILKFEWKFIYWFHSWKAWFTAVCHWLIVMMDPCILFACGHLCTYFLLLFGAIPGCGDINNHDSVAAFLLNRLIHKHNHSQNSVNWMRESDFSSSFL